MKELPLSWLLLAFLADIAQAKVRQFETAKSNLEVHYVHP